MLSCVFLQNRHATKKHGLSVCTNSASEEAAQDGLTKKKEDFVYNYHSARLKLGLFFFNFSDAIKHGDTDRFLCSMKFALLLVYKHKHTKYAYVIFNFFVKIFAILSEKEAYLLLSNRFINSKGRIGEHIPLDLHMEHLKLVLKRFIKGAGGNITNSTLQRCAQSIHLLEEIICKEYTQTVISKNEVVIMGLTVLKQQLKSLLMT